MDWVRNGVYLKNLSLFILLFVVLAHGLYAQSDYRTLHNQSFVVDMHTDVLLNVLRGVDISRKSEFGHVDLVRLKEGGVDVQFFAIWPNPDLYSNGGMYNQSMRLIDRLDKIFGKNPEKISLAKTPHEIDEAVKNGKIAACIGIEGGTAIENDLSKLKRFYDRGARYLTLTWNDSPDWASSAKDETSLEYEGQKGLSEFGRDVIHWMNENGMMIDISHCGNKTFWDVIGESSKPIIASHSCVFDLCPHYRNLNSDQIKAIGENNGVIFINFYPGYLVKGFNQKYNALRKSSQTYLDSMKQVYGNDYLGFREYQAGYLSQGCEKFRPDVGCIVDHIDFIIALIGDDHVGLGSDFDGISIVPKGIDDVSKMPEITRVMVERGYSDERIKKILGGNFMRVFREVSVR